MGKVRTALCVLGVSACATAPPASPEASPSPPSVALAPAASSSAVAPAPSAPSGPALVFYVQPAEAQISIDGVAYGRVDQLATGGVLPLKPGIYRVTVGCPGYTSWRAEVAVKDGPEAIQVTLNKSP
jgi:hypothetical protein